MKWCVVAAMSVVLAGCSVQHVGPPGVTLTRAVKVKARNVMVYNEFQAVPGRYAVVEEVFVKDDGSMSPEEMASNLRVQAGARGANAIVMSVTNRRNNGLRIDTRVRLDNPFDYYSATAIWIGDGPRPETYLGTL